jgi:hypothetical protein
MPTSRMWLGAGTLLLAACGAPVTSTSPAEQLGDNVNGQPVSQSTNADPQRGGGTAVLTIVNPDSDETAETWIALADELGSNVDEFTPSVFDLPGNPDSACAEARRRGEDIGFFRVPDRVGDLVIYIIRC